MIQENRAAAFEEAVVQVVDVAARVVEHARAAAEGHEGAEHVGRGRLVRRKEAPAKAAGMGGVVEEAEVRLRGARAGLAVELPAAGAGDGHVVAVPAREAREPEARGRGVVAEEQRMDHRGDGEVVLEEGELLGPLLCEEVVALRLVGYVVLDHAVVGAVAHHRALEGVVDGAVANVGLVQHVHGSTRHGEVVPVEVVSTEVRRLARAGEFGVFHAHDTAVEGADVGAKLKGVAPAQGRVVPLNLDVAVEEAHGGAQVGRLRALVVPVPNAQVLVLEGFVKDESEPAVGDGLHAAELLPGAAVGGRDEEEGAHRPCHRVREADGGGTRGRGLHDARPAVLGAPVDVQVPHGAHRARVRRRAPLVDAVLAKARVAAAAVGAVGVARAAGQAAEIRDGDHLGADEGELDGVPAVTVEGDRRPLQEGLVLGAHAEGAARHPNVGGVESDVAAVELEQPRDEQEEELGRVLVEKQGLTLGNDH
mmetsp:Transcript_17935/g.52320  ORF Transcript_17935/g.52320 Transcript_17935/m.52320 type:complete len:479 (-) Transcript_17935:2080-3516(-)